MSSSMEARLLAAGNLEARSNLFRTLHSSRPETKWEPGEFLLMRWDVFGEGWDLGGPTQSITCSLGLGVLPEPEQRF